MLLVQARTTCLSACHPCCQLSFTNSFMPDQVGTHKLVQRMPGDEVLAGFTGPCAAPPSTSLLTCSQLNVPKTLFYACAGMGLTSWCSKCLEVKCWQVSLVSCTGCTRTSVWKRCGQRGGGEGGLESVKGGCCVGGVCAHPAPGAPGQVYGRGVGSGGGRGGGRVCRGRHVGEACVRPQLLTALLSDATFMRQSTPSTRPACTVSVTAVLTCWPPQRSPPCTSGVTRLVSCCPLACLHSPTNATPSPPFLPLAYSAAFNRRSPPSMPLPCTPSVTVGVTSQWPTALTP